MSKTSYRFSVGAFECFVVTDGLFAYPHPASLFFVNAPPKQLEEVLARRGLNPQQWDEYVSPFPSLLVDTGRRRILIDTGAGALAPTTGNLIANLQTEGIAPGDIDTVILTHGHPDHIGGNIDQEGRPAFPNARYLMWKEEWEFWTSEPDLSSTRLNDSFRELLLASACANLPPIQGQLVLLERETEILPGIHVFPVPGHTPGHLAVSVISGEEKLLCTADAVLHFIHLEQPQWCSIFDMAPDQVLTGRHLLFDQAASDNALVHATHFPFPGLGHVVQKGEGWEWRPIQMGEGQS